jgi:hypothetical protein
MSAAIEVRAWKVLGFWWAFAARGAERRRFERHFGAWAIAGGGACERRVRPATPGRGTEVLAQTLAGGHFRRADTRQSGGSFARASTLYFSIRQRRRRRLADGAHDFASTAARVQALAMARRLVLRARAGNARCSSARSSSRRAGAGPRIASI